MGFKESLKELQELNSLKKNVKYYEERVNQMLERLTHSRDIVLKDIDRGPYVTITDEQLSTFLDIKKKYEDLYYEHVNKAFLSEMRIEKLPESQKILLRKRYILGYKIEQICNEEHYSYRQVQRNIKKAVRMYSAVEY